MKTYCLFVICIFLSFQNAICQDQEFSKAHIEKDIAFLREKLSHLHPNLYLYSSKQEYEEYYKSIIIPERANAPEAYQLISSVSELLKDGHTLFYPSQATQAYNQEHGKFLPLKGLWDGSDLFVIENYSEDEKIKKGAKIQSINDIPINTLINSMIDNMPRDGDNHHYASWILNVFFFEYYNYFFGSTEVFDLQLDQNGELVSVAIEGLKRQTIYEKYKTYEQGKAIYLNMKPEQQTAELTIRDWHKENLRKHFKQKLNKEINKALKEIINNDIEHLIIDLRDNQGGSFKYSKNLLSHLIDEPIDFIQEFQTKKKSELKKVKINRLKKINPKKNNYQGNIYVLINGGSFSNSCIFSTALQNSNRAILIGQPSGGSQHVLASNAKNIRLPNTGIIISIPTSRIILNKNYEGSPKTLTPTHLIPLKAEHQIERKDVAKGFIYEKFIENTY